MLHNVFWQTCVRPEDQWKTAFICDDGLFEWTRTAFGMKSSGSTFVRAVQIILQPIKAFADAYVDDLTVFSGLWAEHLD
ncbi:MAG TPA: reverse transcriptase domain-containing protein, partial [Methylococcales bacterium]